MMNKFYEINQWKFREKKKSLNYLGIRKCSDKFQLAVPLSKFALISAAYAPKLRYNFLLNILFLSLMYVTGSSSLNALLLLKAFLLSILKRII